MPHSGPDLPVRALDAVRDALLRIAQAPHRAPGFQVRVLAGPPSGDLIRAEIQLVSLSPPGEEPVLSLSKDGPQGRMRVRDGNMALPNSGWR